MSRAEEILGRLELFGIRLGLDTTRPLLSALGEPQRRVPTVLVAGTNGKGSTATLLAAMAHAAGYRTGLYTSPHLEVVEERLRIDGMPIPESDLGTVLEQVVEAGESVLEAPPTYFEALTAAAWVWFAERQVDVAIMEIGMGGRLDATNAGEPLLSVITPIGLDHTQHLGSTLTAIAGEKAGILRPQIPAVSWPGSAEASKAIAAAAAALGTPLTVAPGALRHLDRQPGTAGAVGQQVHLETASASYTVELALPGQHQAQNFALATLAAEELGRSHFPRLGREAILRGAAGCRWPGRLEHVVCPPPAQGREILLDAAHNPAGIEVLATFLAEEPRFRDRRYDLLFGAFANKDAEAMLVPLVQSKTGASRARRIVLTQPEGRTPHSPQELARFVAPGTPILAPEVPKALQAALPGDGLLVVTGSLYLVGDVRRLLRARLGVPASPVEPIFEAASHASPAA